MKQVITSPKKNRNFYRNISILPEHQSSIDYLKYINSSNNSHHPEYLASTASQDVYQNVDFFLKYQAKTCKSYIRDTSDFLLKLKSLSTTPSTSIFVSMGVNSLYTNIDHEEGTYACYKNLETRKNKTVSSNTSKNCILLILKSNIFRFCNTFHIQKKGTAMGTPMAANYANLFSTYVSYSCRK